MFSFGKVGINVPSEAGPVILGIAVIVILWRFLASHAGKSRDDTGIGTDADDPDVDEYADIEDILDDFEDFDKMDDDD